MGFIFELSLEKMALVKVASTLWNRSEIRALRERKIEWKNFEEEVLKKVEKLPQPQALQKKITGYVKLVGFEIFHFLANLSKMTPHLPAYFSWTPQGAVDSRETARLLLQDQTIHPVARYKLAFTYCLEGDVQVIWDSIPEDFKSLISGHTPTFINEQNLADVWASDYPESCFRIFPEAGAGGCFWIFPESGTGSCFWIFPEAGTGSYGKSFLNAVKFDNKVAAEYFCRKLPPTLRRTVLAKAMRDSSDPEVLYFLLSQMDEEQRQMVLRHESSRLMRILRWPWLSIFVEAANLYWDSENGDRTSPLRILVSKVFDGNNDLLEAGIYQELFRQLWLCACDRFGVDVCVDPQLLYALFEIKDKENIGLIFQDASPALKKDFIWSSKGLRISRRLVRENKWDLLDFFIQHCLTSEHEMTQYKEKVCLEADADVPMLIYDTCDS